MATALGSLLKQAGVTAQPQQPNPAPPRETKPVPPHAVAQAGTPPQAARERALSTAELRMLNDAYEGAKPLQPKHARATAPAERAIAAESRKRDPRVFAQERAEEAAARSRLAALVSEGVRFKIRREQDYVEGLRLDTSPRLLARIQASGFVPDATLDLHGFRVNQLDAAIERFIRSHYRRGARRLLLIVGKGLRSNTGVSQLRPAAIEALTQGLAAPWVVAFGTAHGAHGGGGALAVLLRD